MTEVFPDYYNSFQCIADRCRHSCCIGWEIDIDEDTLELYKSMDIRSKAEILKGTEGSPPHFKLKEDERCFFLKDNGLCDIICRFGKEALCEICSLHPRFKNFYSSFTEVGLGLSCEEAARIILTDEKKFDINFPEGIALTDEEKEFFRDRAEVFGVLQNRQKSVLERFYDLGRKFDFEISFDTKKLLEDYLSLERLDETWTDELLKLKDYAFDGKIFSAPGYQVPFEQLAVYFVFRHFSEDVWDYSAPLSFAVKSCVLIGALVSLWESENKENGMEKLIDIARMYSSEIEYSDENTEKIMFEVI